MDISEIKKMLNGFRLTFPNSFNKLTKEEKYDMVNEWHSEFKDTPAEVVQIAANIAITESSLRFAPTLSQIKSLIWKAQSEKDWADYEKQFPPDVNCGIWEHDHRAAEIRIQGKTREDLMAGLNEAMDEMRLIHKEAVHVKR